VDLPEREDLVVKMDALEAVVCLDFQVHLV